VTPSPATFLDVRVAVAVPVCVLIRPRPGGFVYSPQERATIRRDAEWFLTHGADAIVCGELDEAGRLVRPAAGRAVLHRCVDFLPDLRDGLRQAIDLGFSRVLTSGGAHSALAGTGAIRELVREAAGRIEVLPGGGVDAGNVADLVAATGCDQVHGAFRSAVAAVSHPLTDAMGREMRTDPGKVAAVRAELDRIVAGGLPLG